MLSHMGPNHTTVTPPTTFATEAEELLAHADHVEDVLDALRGPSDRSINAKISDAHNELGHTFKRAEVVSNLAIAEALDRLTEQVRLVANLPEVDRNARAYGWEIGRGQDIAAVVHTTDGNPFMRGVR